MKAIIVEDETGIVETLLGYLARADVLCVDVASSGEEALVLVAQTAYDLVILDLYLSSAGKGGLDVLPDLRSRAPQSTIAIVSGYPDLVTEEDMQLADLLIHKPVKMDTFRHLAGLVKTIAEKRAEIRALGDPLSPGA